MRDDEVGMNYPLSWLRGDSGDRGIQSLNFQGIGVSPLMQPRLDTSMLGMQTSDIYQAMAAAARQDMRAVDTLKQTNPSLLQFQQAQGGSIRSAGLLHNQMMQQSQPQAQFLQNLGENLTPAHTQSQLLQQQQQQQHHHHHHQQQHPPIRSQQEQLVDGHQVPSTVPLLSQFGSHSQSSSFQTMSSIQQQSFHDSNAVRVTSPVVSPLHSLLGSFPQDEASQLINFPRSSALLASSGWPAKRVAVDPILSSGSVEQLGSLHTNFVQSAVSLPPFPGRECAIDQDVSNDPHSHLLFGVNIDSPSLLVQNGISSLRGVSNDGDSTTIHFASNYMSTSGADYSINPSMTPTSCIDESSFLQSPDDSGQANPSTRTFVKVSCLILGYKFLVFFLYMYASIARSLRCVVLVVYTFNI